MTQGEVGGPSAGVAAETPGPVEPARPYGQSLALGAAAGLAAALVGGFVWAQLVKHTDYEIGIAAWGIGILAGLAVVYGSGHRRDPAFQVIAVVCALVGILVGKYLTYVYFVREGVAAEFGSEVADRVKIFSSDTVRFFKEDADLVFSGIDLLWIGLAVVSAWRVFRWAPAFAGDGDRSDVTLKPKQP